MFAFCGVNVCVCMSTLKWFKSIFVVDAIITRCIRLKQPLHKTNFSAVNLYTVQCVHVATTSYSRVIIVNLFNYNSLAKLLWLYFVRVRIVSFPFDDIININCSIVYPVEVRDDDFTGYEWNGMAMNRNDKFNK